MPIAIGYIILIRLSLDLERRVCFDEISTCYFLVLSTMKTEKPTRN